MRILSSATQVIDAHQIAMSSAALTQLISVNTSHDNF